jgi:hypothetical protein
MTDAQADPWWFWCPDTGVTAYSLHPGGVVTELGRHIPFINTTLGQTLLKPVAWLLLKTSVEGAQTTLYCALAPELEKVSGKYYR